MGDQGCSVLLQAQGPSLPWLGAVVTLIYVVRGWCSCSLQGYGKWGLMPVSSIIPLSLLLFQAILGRNAGQHLCPWQQACLGFQKGLRIIKRDLDSAKRNGNSAQLIGRTQTRPTARLWPYLQCISRGRSADPSHHDTPVLNLPSPSHGQLCTVTRPQLVLLVTVQLSCFLWIG